MSRQLVKPMVKPNKLMAEIVQYLMKLRQAILK